MNNEQREAIALWRLGVLGPLVSAHLEHGDRASLIREAASRNHQLPDGRIVRIKARTIAGWFYNYRHGGWRALMPAVRSDCASSRSIPPHVAEQLLRAKQHKPRRSIYRLIRMMERAKLVQPGELSKSRRAPITRAGRGFEASSTQRHPRTPQLPAGTRWRRVDGRRHARPRSHRSGRQSP